MTKQGGPEAKKAKSPRPVYTQVRPKLIWKGWEGGWVENGTDCLLRAFDLLDKSLSLSAGLHRSFSSLIITSHTQKASLACSSAAVPAHLLSGAPSRPTSDI